MTTATRTITVARPVGDVFTFFADAERDPLWRTEVLSARRRPGTDPSARGTGQGTRYDQELRGPGGRVVRATAEVTEHVPHGSVAFVADARGLRRRRRYVFADLGGGRTSVTLTIDAEPTGPLGFLRRSEVQEWADDAVGSLAWAKALLESGRPEPVRQRRH